MTHMKFNTGDSLLTLAQPNPAYTCVNLANKNEAYETVRNQQHNSAPGQPHMYDEIEQYQQQELDSIDMDPVYADICPRPSNVIQPHQEQEFHSINMNPVYAEIYSRPSEAL